MLGYKKLIILVIFSISLVIFTHNVRTYPLLSGFDATRKIAYAKIISNEWRFPTEDETSNQTYDAPLFYVVSGLMARLITSISDLPFIEAIGLTRIFLCCLVIISFYIWYKIFSHFYPNERAGAFVFLLLLSSIPGFYKIGSMFVPEMFCLFIASVIIYFYLNNFLKKPSLKNIIILSILISIGLLTRISFFSLMLALFISISMSFFIIKNRLLGLKILTIFSLIIIILTGWFYLIKHSGKLLEFGNYSQRAERGYANIPLLKRQRLAFYYDVPFKLMMNYPIRPWLSQPSYLIPIYYSDFWGDYWNFYPQTRFGESESQNSKLNRQVFSDTRRKYLVWQNWINLIPTILMVTAFIFMLVKRISNLLSNKVNRKILSEIFLLLFVMLTWASLLLILTKYPGEGDFIKVSYTLYIIPIYIYFTVVFLFTYLKKIKIVFWPVVSILLFSILNNFIFSWY